MQNEHMYHRSYLKKHRVGEQKEMNRRALVFVQSSFSGTCNTGRKFLSLFVYIVMMIVLPSGRKRLRCRNLFNRFEDIYS